MAYIKRDGKVYEQIISEVEVDLQAEEYKLQAWKDALVSDAREEAERQAKFAEIDAVDLDEELKETLKAQLVQSGTGIKQEMVDAQEAKLSEIKRVNGNKF